jgi:hypothetical protein
MMSWALFGLIAGFVAAFVLLYRNQPPREDEWNG